MNDIDIKISEKVAEEAGKQMNQLKKSKLKMIKM